MKKYVKVTILTILVMLIGIVTVYAANPTLSLTPSKTEVKAGDTFTVKVKVKSDSGIEALDSTLKYDESKLELTSATVANNFTDLSGKNDKTGEYKLSFLYNGSTQLKEIDIVTLNFKVLSKVTDKETLNVSLASIELNDSKDQWIKLGEQKTSVTVKTGSAGTTSNASLSLTPSKTEVKAGDTFTVKVKVKSDSGIEALDSTLKYDESKLELTSATVANNFTDLSGKNDTTGEYKLSFLYNGSTQLKESDIVTLNFKVLSKVTDKETLNVSLASIELNDSKDQWIKLGEQKTSLTVKTGSAGTTSNASLSLTPSKTEIKAGDTFTVKVKVKSDSGIEALDSTLKYDESKLELTSVTVANNFTDLSGKNDTTGEYKLSFLYNGSESLKEVDIVTLTFKVLNTVKDKETLNVTLSSIELNDSKDQWIELGEKKASLTVKTASSGDTPGNNNTNTDNSQTNTNLPYTGMQEYGFAVVGLIVLVVSISYVKYRQYKNI